MKYLGMLDSIGGTELNIDLKRNLIVNQKLFICKASSFEMPFTTFAVLER
jgi:hypothetical protein